MDSGGTSPKAARRPRWRGNPPLDSPLTGSEVLLAFAGGGGTFDRRRAGGRTPSSSLRAQGNFDATFVVSTVGGPSPQPSPRGTLRQAQGERIRCCDVGLAHPPGGSAALAPPARPRPRMFFENWGHIPQSGSPPQMEGATPSGLPWAASRFSRPHRSPGERGPFDRPPSRLRGQRIRCCDVGWAHPPGGSAALAPPARPRPGKVFLDSGGTSPKAARRPRWRGVPPLDSPKRARRGTLTPTLSPWERGRALRAQGERALRQAQGERGPFDRPRGRGDGPSTGSG